MRRWKRRDVSGIIEHELNHLFWHHAFGAWSPYWLCEGLACVVGGQYALPRAKVDAIIREYGVDRTLLDYRFLPRKLLPGPLPRYPIWAAFTRYLLARYGPQTFSRFLRALVAVKRKDDYHRVFARAFGVPEHVAFKRFIANLE